MQANPPIYEGSKFQYYLTMIELKKNIIPAANNWPNEHKIL